MKTYLHRFLEDKDLLEKEVTLSDDNFGDVIGLYWSDLADFVANMPTTIQKQIENTMTKIDFNNGDYQDYLNYLVKGMVFGG